VGWAAIGGLYVTSHVQLSLVTALSSTTTTTTTTVNRNIKYQQRRTSRVSFHWPDDNGCNNGNQ